MMQATAVRLAKGNSKDDSLHSRDASKSKEACKGSEASNCMQEGQLLQGHHLLYIRDDSSSKAARISRSQQQ